MLYQSALPLIVTALIIGALFAYAISQAMKGM